MHERESWKKTSKSFKNSNLYKHPNPMSSVQNFCLRPSPFYDTFQAQPLQWLYVNAPSDQRTQHPNYAYSLSRSASRQYSSRKQDRFTASTEQSTTREIGLMHPFQSKAANGNAQEMERAKHEQVHDQHRTALQKTFNMIESHYLINAVHSLLKISEDLPNITGL